MKGFMFSIEALLAVGLIAVAVTALWTTVNEPQTNDLVNLKLQNSEVIHLYFNTQTTTPANHDNQKCTLLYYYDSKTSKTYFEPKMSAKTICEGN